MKRAVIRRLLSWTASPASRSARNKRSCGTCWRERELASCALCGHEYPIRFLVAAHVKKRSICNDDERRDLRHVAMLACTFGCDALYEAGWITVGQDGHVQTVPLDGVPEGRIRDHLRHLAGHRCAAHCHASEPYFGWHRTTMFRGPT